MPYTEGMMQGSLQLGPFSLPAPLLLFIAAAAIAHLVLYLILRKEKEEFKTLSDGFFNLLIIYLLFWRLSLLISNGSTVLKAPLALLYLPGSLINHLIAAAIALGAAVLTGKRKGWSRKRSFHLGLMTGIALALFILFNLTGRLAVISGGEPEAPDSSVSSQIEAADKALTLDDGEGNPVALDTAGGKITIVNFWATWCPPCRAEIPELKDFYENLDGSEDIRLIAVNLTSSEKSGLAAVKSFIKNEEISFPVYYDSRGQVAAFYGINAVPTTLVFDRDGTLLTRKTGAVDRAWLEKFIPR